MSEYLDAETGNFVAIDAYINGRFCIACNLPLKARGCTTAKCASPPWREMDWGGFCEWVQGREVRSADVAPLGAQVRILFADGSSAEVSSNATISYGEIETEAPTARVRDAPVKL